MHVTNRNKKYMTFAMDFLAVFNLTVEKSGKLLQNSNSKNQILAKIKKNL